MKKYKFLYLILINIMFIFSGCSNPKFNISQSINAPKNNSVPIGGTYTFTDIIYSNSKEKSDTKSLLGRTAQFSQNAAVINNDICKNPNYKIKVVNSEDYLLYNYRISAHDLKIENTNIVVITITSNDKHFSELVKINDNKFLINIDGNFYYLNKISDKTNIATYFDNTNKNNNNVNNKDSSINSGVLLGIKNSSENILKSESTYKTIWIESHNTTISPILESKNIFMPRKSGFWEIKLTRQKNNNLVQDNFYVSQFETDVNKNLKSDNSESEQISDINKIISNVSQKNVSKNIYRNINFIANDYICTEYSNNTKIKSNKLENLQVLPIDNVNNSKGLTITSLMGEAAHKIFLDSANAYLTSHDKDETKYINQYPSQDNFTITRKNGHWIMEGRFNSINNSSPENFQDFTLNIFPPKKMLNYDELYVSWNEVKSKVPSAYDVFTSPNKDIALIICKNKIYIYKIKDGFLGKSPLKQITLKNTESIIMAEWATGSYVKKWSNVFNNYIKANQ